MHRIIVSYSKELEIIPMSINRRTDKLSHRPAIICYVKLKISEPQHPHQHGLILQTKFLVPKSQKNIQSIETFTHNS